MMGGQTAAISRFRAKSSRRVSGTFSFEFFVEYRRTGYDPEADAHVRTERLEARLMARLLDMVRDLVNEGKYVVGKHAAERLEERGILEWQAVAGREDDVLIAKRPDASPNPAVEVRESLPDGTDLEAVWSLLPQSGVAKLVTVQFFDRR